MNASTTRHQNLVIVGSGPVGMVAALLLQEHFEQVTLLERRTQEDFLQAQGFTFPIVFSPASIRILQQIGIWDAIRAERSEFFGVVIHQRVLGRELSFTSVREGVYSHWRNHVVAKLYEQVQAAGIPIHFEAQVEAIDFQNNVCREARLGDLPFDLLLGADGSNSQTRRLLAQAHPDFPADSFKRIGLDHWYAYRVPSRGAMRERFAGGERHHASNVFLSNLAAYPSEKFRIVTTGMRQPEEEISILIKHDPAITPSRLKVLNDSYFGPLVGSQQELDAAWQAGYAGRFDQVQAPTFHLNRVLLIGDAAHGFESTGDLDHGWAVSRHLPWSAACPGWPRTSRSRSDERKHNKTSEPGHRWIGAGGHGRCVAAQGALRAGHPARTAHRRGLPASAGLHLPDRLLARFHSHPATDRHLGCHPCGTIRVLRGGHPPACPGPRALLHLRPRRGVLPLAEPCRRQAVRTGPGGGHPDPLRIASGSHRLSEQRLPRGPARRPALRPAAGRRRQQQPDAPAACASPSGLPCRFVQAHRPRPLVCVPCPQPRCHARTVRRRRTPPRLQCLSQQPRRVSHGEVPHRHHRDAPARGRDQHPDQARPGDHPIPFEGPERQLLRSAGWLTAGAGCSLAGGICRAFRPGCRPPPST